MVKIAVIYHSSLGHTEVIAEQILLGASVGGNDVRMFEYNAVDLDYINLCEAIIFGCPTYMGSVSSELKSFMDSTSPIWRKQLWRNKIAAAFTNSAALSGDKLGTLNQIALFAFQHGMIWVGLDLVASCTSSKASESNLNRIGSWIGLMTQSNTDQGPDLTPPEGDRKTAEYFGKRIANIANSINFSEIE
jgi:NAD(P)H dehydrogenase (quinone)